MMQRRASMLCCGLYEADNRGLWAKCDPPNISGPETKAEVSPVCVLQSKQLHVVSAENEPGINQPR